MLPQREPLPAVTAAGIVAVIFAVFGILGCAVVMVSLVTLPLLPANPSAPAVPEATRAMVVVLYAFFLAIFVGELVVAINVLRRRNWARIAILIWAGIMVFLSAASCIVLLFIFSAMPQTTQNVGNPAAFLLFMKFFMVVFYGVPCGVGIWWLVLFTRRRVVDAFQSSGALAQIPPMDASGFPAPAVAIPPPAPKKPSVRCPSP